MADFDVYLVAPKIEPRARYAEEGELIRTREGAPEEIRTSDLQDS